MKSNLTKNDYLYLIEEAMIQGSSELNIKINNIRGKIECNRILINMGNVNIDGKYNPSIYKCGFKFLLNNIDYKNIHKFVEENKTINVDNIEYYLGNYTITKKDEEKITTEIKFISYNIFSEDNFK